MGVAININVKNENEFNQQLQMYLAQGYRMQSSFKGTAVLSKKGYSTALLVILLIFGIILGVIYYLVSSNDVVTIINTNEGGSTSNQNTENFSSYCSDCGHGLFKDSKFCPGCGKSITGNDEQEPEINEEPEEQNNVCKSCGEELNEDEKFLNEVI